MDVKIPAVPFSGIEKISLNEFVDSNFMEIITRDTPKDSWPRWIASLISDATIDKVYPLLWKEMVFKYFRNQIITFILIRCNSYFFLFFITMTILNSISMLTYLTFALS